MEMQSVTAQVAISVQESRDLIQGILKVCPIYPGVAMDIVIRSWELATIDPVEYYDEMRSIIYDELHSVPNTRLTFAGTGIQADVRDQLADRTFNQLHDLMLTLRPYLDASVGTYRISGQYEYMIHEIVYIEPTLIIKLLRSDKVLDYYRSKGVA